MHAPSPRRRRSARRPLGPANGNVAQVLPSAPLLKAAEAPDRRNQQAHEGPALLAHAAEVSALRAAVRGGALGVAVHTLTLSGAGGAAKLGMEAGRRALGQVHAPADPHADPDILTAPHALAVLLVLGGDLRAPPPDACWSDPPPFGSAEAEAGAAAAAALATTLYPGLLPADTSDPSAPLLDAAYSHSASRAVAARAAVEGLLLAAMAAAGPAGAFSSLAFARAAGFGRLARVARAAAAADVGGGTLADSAGLASLTLADLRAVLLLPPGSPASSAAAAPSSPPRPAVPARVAFDAVSTWYEADPVARAPAAAGLLEACIRLRRLRPHELEAIAEAPLMNATPDATAEFARAYLDVSYMGVWEFEEVEEEEEEKEAAVAHPTLPGGGAVLGGAVLQGVLPGAGLTPPRRRQRQRVDGVVRPASGGAMRRPLLF